MAPFFFIFVVFFRDLFTTKFSCGRPGFFAVFPFTVQSSVDGVDFVDGVDGGRNDRFSERTR